MQPDKHWKPFDYQYHLKEKLKKWGMVWSWFDRSEVREEYIEKLKGDFLRHAERMDPAKEPGIYEQVEKVMMKLSLSLPLIIYHENKSPDARANIVYTGNEAHLVFSGPIMTLLSETEMQAVIAHKLGLVLFLSPENQDYEVADRMLTAMINDTRSEDIYRESAGMFRLFKELYCDQIAMLVCGDPDVLLSALWKMQNASKAITPEAFLRQAEEALSPEGSGLEGAYCPDVYIRAMSLQKMKLSNDRQQTEDVVLQMIRRKQDVQRPDLIMQEEIRILTGSLIASVLKPQWMKSARNLLLAQKYFPDYKTSDEGGLDATQIGFINDYSKSVRSYLACVLHDFAWSDPALGKASAGQAYQIAANCGLKNEFFEIFCKEKEMSVRKANEWCAGALKEAQEMSESGKTKISDAK